MPLFEGGHHLFGEQFQRLADMLVAVIAGLLHEHYLVHARVLQSLQVFAYLGRVADSGRRFIFLRHVALKILPNVEFSGHVAARNIEMAEGVAEELEVTRPSPLRLATVLVKHKSGYDRDVGIDRPADRVALPLKSLVVLLYPVGSAGGIDKGKGQRAHTVAGRDFDRLPVRAGQP